MGIVELIGMLLKIAGQALDLYSKNSLTREHLDAAVGALHLVGPPKEDTPTLTQKQVDAGVAALKAAGPGGKP